MKSVEEILLEKEEIVKGLIEQNTMLARNHLLLEQDFKECFDLLFEMVYQVCAVHPYGVEDCLDSKALRTNVEEGLFGIREKGL